MVRQRHPASAAQRVTHTTSPVDYAKPSDSLYGSEMDIEAVTMVDLGAGSVTDGAIAPGGLDGGTLIRAGTMPPAVLDAEPPPPPSDFSLASAPQAQPDGSTVVGITVSFAPPVGGWPADYFGMYIYTTNDSDNDPTTPTPVWNHPIVTFVGGEFTQGYVTGLPGGTQHWVYLRAVDVTGNLSAPTVTKSIMTASDTSAPSIPQALDGLGGYRSIGLYWLAPSDSDLMHQEVRYAAALGAGPDTDNWVVLRTRQNVASITNLLPGDYYAQVRAVDFSQNVAGRWVVTGLATTDVFTCAAHTFVNGQTVRFEEVVGGVEVAISAPLYVINATATTFQVSLTVGGGVLGISTNLTGFVGETPTKAVNYLTDTEAGWTYLVGPLTATLIGTDEIYFNSVLAGIVRTNTIDAGTIQTGILKVKTTAGPYADGIQMVYGTDNRVVGEWNEKWLDIRSLTAGRQGLDYIRLYGGLGTAVSGPEIVIYKDGVATTAMTKDGINATSINFGVAPGGHNLLFNSSFELSKFIISVKSILGTGGSTFAGGVGGWVLSSNTNGTLAAGAITMATL